LCGPFFCAPDTVAHAGFAFAFDFRVPRPTQLVLKSRQSVATPKITSLELADNSLDLQAIS
jgi:hypothetical protein